MAETELTRARFAALAEAFGADLRRWPAELRPAARRMAARDPDATALLAEADRLDVLLDGWRVTGAGAASTQAAIAAAPRLGVMPRAWRWWTGLGLAGAALAGSLSGAAAIAMAPPPPLAAASGQPAETVALFDDPTADERP